jgi:gluconate 2-dehydrogenase gamma chain
MATSSRRQFITHTALGFGAYLAVGAGACRKPAALDAVPIPSGPNPEFDAARSTGAGLFTLTAAQFAAVAAATERILPRDEDPGAIDLGVPFYVDRTLANPDLADWKKAFMQGLGVLDRQCTKNFGKAFADCSEEQQDVMLTRWQEGKSGETRFFQILMNLTLEGAFGDPVHGGNKDGLGFAMVGFVPDAPLPAPELIKVGKHAHHKGG